MQTSQLAYQTGETHLLFGQRLYLQLLVGDSGQARVENGRLLLPVKEIQVAPVQMQKFYRQQLWKEIQQLIPKCEAIVGKQAEEWKIKKMKTRWGSCNVQKKRIWLNLLLAQKPLSCLEYVMLHELTHLWEANHGSAFWRYMDQFCPNWRGEKAKLNGVQEK